MGTVDHPYVDETLLTFEQQLGQDMMIGVDFIDRRFRSIMAMVNINEDYELFTAPDNPFGGGDLPIYNLLSQPEFVLTTDNGGYRDYQSAILRFEKRYSHGWQLRTSLVWTDLKGNILKNNGYADEFEDKQRLHQRRRQDGHGVQRVGVQALRRRSTCRSTSSSSGQYTYLSGWYWTPYVRVRGLDYNA